MTDIDPFPEINTNRLSSDTAALIECLVAIHDALFVVNNSLQILINSTDSVDEAIRTTVI